MSASRDPKDRRYSRCNPCEECPFARATVPGTVGGSDPTVYLGQICGPFVLSCHMDPQYTGRTTPDQLQVMHCAGAAIYRANLGVADDLPDSLHALPPDGGERVFTTPEELIAHHRRISLNGARAQLRETPLLALAIREMAKVAAGHAGKVYEQKEREAGDGDEDAV